MTMLVQHLYPQNTADLSQRLEMVDVHDERPNGVVQNRAKSLHVRCELRTSHTEELIKQSMLILTCMHEKSARRAKKRTMVAFMLNTQVFDGIIDCRAHNHRTLRQIQLVQFRQQILILCRFLIAIFDEFNYFLNFRWRCLKLAIEHRKCSLRRLVGYERCRQLLFGIENLLGRDSQRLCDVILNHLNAAQ